VITTEVEFVLAQVNVVVCPAATTLGERLSVIDGAEPCGTTVTTTEEVAVFPFASVAVPTYVVVCAGDTLADPVSGSVPEVTAGEIENDAALVTFQLSVVLCPWTITLESAAKAMTACEAPPLPLPPPVPLLTPPQPQTKVKIKTKESCSTADEVFDRNMAHSHPGVMAEM